jgi:DNA-binding transcriptional LysR family regulator
MDTRQLAAFCAVVEKKSFSQAAERLGVTQPAVSLQIRALEKRLGAQLLDRSGRRVEPTEAGQRLYRNAQRVLAAEEQLLDELTEGERIAGRFELGASTGPGGSVVPLLLGELARTYPELSVALTVADTHRIVELVADRALELGVVGFARRHRSVVFEPLFRDQVVLACPPAHRFAGRTISLDQLREETLILMQEGAGVREAIEDELRAAGMRSRDFDARLELGLQESVRAAVEAGFGVTFISRSAIEAALAAGTLTEAHVKGLEPSREIFRARAAGRTLTRAAQAFLDLARERLG